MLFHMTTIHLMVFWTPTGGTIQFLENLSGAIYQEAQRSTLREQWRLENVCCAEQKQTSQRRTVLWEQLVRHCDNTNMAHKENYNWFLTKSPLSSHLRKKNVYVYISSIQNQFKHGGRPSFLIQNLVKQRSVTVLGWIGGTINNHNSPLVPGERRHDAPTTSPPLARPETCWLAYWVILGSYIEWGWVWGGNGSPP